MIIRNPDCFLLPFAHKTANVYLAKYVVGADLCVCPNENNSQQIMVLNDAGKMVEKWYAELENKYPDIRCHEMIVMPNHFHCIIEKIEGYENDNQKWECHH